MCHSPSGVLIANKVDLRDSGRAVVEEKEGRALAKSLGLAYFETSAVRRVQGQADAAAGRRGRCG